MKRGLFLRGLLKSGRCDACIKRAIAAAGQYIDAGLFIHTMYLDSGVRRKDGLFVMYLPGLQNAADPAVLL